jgi:hypothetical protein
MDRAAPSAGAEQPHDVDSVATTVATGKFIVATAATGGASGGTHTTERQGVRLPPRQRRDVDWIHHDRVEGDKRIRKTVSAKTGAGVREKLRVARAKIDAGLPLDDDKLTVNQLLDRWFNGAF